MPHDTGGRQSMVDAAARLFSQKGYKGVSIRAIAQACGVSNAALYYHFRNKDDLFLAVLRRNHETIMQSLAGDGDPGGAFRERLTQLVMRYGGVMCDQRQSFQMMRRDLSHIDDPRAGKLFGEMRANFMRPIHDLIVEGQAAGRVRPGDALLLARILHGMIAALTFEGLNRRPRLTASEADALVDVFLHGVAR